MIFATTAGEREVVRALRQFKKSVRSKMLRKGVTAYLAPAKSLLKGNPTMPIRTGALRRSIGSVVRTKKGVVTGHVGARKGFKITSAQTKRGRYTSGGKGVSDALASGRKVLLDVTPSRYLHLAEKKWGFVAQAAMQARTPGRDAFVAKMRTEIAAEAAKLRAQSKVK